MQISCGVVYSNLNESDPWIYKKGKTMFHMTFPYGETCDSEQYSIHSEIQAESILWGEKKRNWEYPKDVVRLEKAQGHRSRGMPWPHPHADWAAAQNSAAASFKGRLKGKSSLMPCGKLPELKCKYRKA